MRQNLTFSIAFFARLFLLCTLVFTACLFSLSAKHLKAYNIEDIDSPLATIQGRVWLDANENGSLDTEDPGLENVLVKLSTQSGIVQRVLTDEQGIFVFDSLATGTYDLEFINPLDYQFTAGSNSDVERETGRIDGIDINDDETAFKEFLAGVVYQPQHRATSSIGLDMFEVSPSVLNGEPAVFIEWETSREEGTEGFYILRSPTGYFEQAIPITELIISQGRTNSTDVNRYEHWDTKTRSGNIYSYWLQEIEIGGVTAEYGPELTVGVGPGNGDHSPPVTGVDTPVQDNYIYLPIILR